jgi:hypothetical protein
MTHRYRTTGPEPVLSTTGDAKNDCAAAVSPLSPVSPLEVKNLLKQCTRSNPFARNTSDTGEVVRAHWSRGGEAMNVRGSTP